MKEASGPVVDLGNRHSQVIMYIRSTHENSTLSFFVNSLYVAMKYILWNCTLLETANSLEGPSR